MIDVSYRRFKRAGRNFAWVGPLLFLVFVALRIELLSNLNPETVGAISQSINIQDLAIQSILDFMPLGLIIGLIYFSDSRQSTKNHLERIATYLIVALILFIAIFFDTANWYVCTLVVGVLCVVFDIGQRIYLAFAVERRERMDRRAERFARFIFARLPVLSPFRRLTISVVVPIFLVMVTLIITVQALNTPIWLPAQEFHLSNPSKTFSGYLLSSTSHTETILTYSSDRIHVYDSAKLTPRNLCHENNEATKPIWVTFFHLPSGHNYRRCTN